ncbi:MAG TPA: hypothetical protein VD905_06490 [Flavobacteriales bacterium]|nr:hypothetical protein [Flavobacteriales bacterium]
MKKFTLFLILPVLVALAAFTFPRKDDNYKVIKVNGQIVVTATGKPLAQGDIFKENTPLDFGSPEAKATVINAEKGRFILTSQAKSSKASNLIPAINNIASRGGAVLTIIDLQNLFAGNFCVIEKMKVKIAAPDYKMNADNFFYLQYKYKGEAINKPMSYTGDSLVIDKVELYKVDGKPITAPDDTQVTLFFRDNVKKTAKTISTFNLIFPNENELREEIKIIINELKTKNASQKTDEVLSYLNEFYGKADRDNVQPWLQKNFAIK